MTTTDTSAPRPTSRDFPIRWPMTTRWSDNDMFGHLNNAVYYELFDSAINGWIIEATGIDETRAQEIGVVAESGCTFYSELAYPDPLVVGIAVRRLGRTSITYSLGLFRAADLDNDPDGTPTAALGHWVHVYIDRDTRRPTPIPDELRKALAALTTAGER